jgi:HK97 family phage major capsid protein
MKVLTIDEIIEKAFATGDLASGGLLNPEQAAAFIRKLIDNSVVLREARRVPMGAPKRLIEKIGFGSRIMQAAAEGTAPGTTHKPATSKVELSVVEALAAVDITYSALEDNIERQNLQQTILDLIAERAALDLEELALHGDTASADPYLALLDGFFKQATSHVVNAGTTAISQDLFIDALKALPGKYMRNPAEWRFYVHRNVELDYRSLLAERATGAGDRYLLENAPVFVGGVPVVFVPAIKSRASGPDTVSDALLTHPQNVIGGFHRDISTELERKPRARVIESTTTVRVDFKFEEEDAVVKITNIKHL